MPVTDQNDALMRQILDAAGWRPYQIQRLGVLKETNRRRPLEITSVVEHWEWLRWLCETGRLGELGE